MRALSFFIPLYLALMRDVVKYLLVSFSLLLFIAVLTILQGHWNYSLFLLLRSVLLLVLVLALLRLLYELLQLPRITEGYKNGFLTLFGFGVIVVGAELVFTFVPVSHGVGFSYAGKNWRFYYESRNAAGFRDQTLAEKDFDQRTVVFIGDSFTEGQGVRNTTDRFAEQLIKRLGPCYEMLLLAKGGMHTRDQIQQLQELDITPEIIVFQYYGNDIEGDANTLGHHRQPIVGYADLSPLSSYFVRASYFLNYFYWRKARSYLSPYHDFLVQSYSSDTIMEEHLSSLQQFKELASQTGADLYFLGIPYLQDVELSEQLFLTRLNSLFDDSDKRSYAIDLSPTIRSIPVEDRMVNRNDPHASEIVHQLIAIELAERIGGRCH